MNKNKKLQHCNVLYYRFLLFSFLVRGPQFSDPCPRCMNIVLYSWKNVSMYLWRHICPILYRDFLITYFIRNDSITWYLQQKSTSTLFIFFRAEVHFLNRFFHEDVLHVDCSSLSPVGIVHQTKCLHREPRYIRTELRKFVYVYFFPDILDRM